METWETPGDTSEREEASGWTWPTVAWIKYTLPEPDFDWQWLFNNEDKSHKPTLPHNIIKYVFCYCFYWETPSGKHGILRV